MSNTIKTRIIKIGNSQGIRIPKLLLEQSSIREDVDIEVQENSIIIRPAQGPRAGWDDAFSAMANHQDDTLLDPINTTDWDQSEWQW